MPSIQPLNASFGAVITDVKLGKLNDEDWQKIEEAFNEYGALVFPNQHTTDEEHIAFAERFGPIEYLRGEGEKAAWISNVNPDGTVMETKHY